MTVVGIETIPIEILCDIFCLLRGNRPIYLDTLDSARGFPWVAGQVCRRWRETFISHSPLWTSLSLHLDYGLFRSASYNAEINRRTAIYIERSGRLPLTISISLHPTSHKHPSQTITTLVSCSSRWKNLDLSISDSSVIDFFLRCKGNLPILTSLKIRGDVVSNLSSIFEATPCLTGLDLSERMGRIAFPWAQLTRVIMFMRFQDYDRYGIELLQVLSQSLNIEMLHLHGAPVYPWYSLAIRSDFPAVHFPRLLLFQTTLGYFEIFSCFNAPSLQHLWIDNSYEDVAWSHRNWNGVLSLINRSTCSIRRLTLRQGTFSMAPVSLAVLASVEELFIIECSSHTFPDIIRYIAGFDGTIYLPKLRVLKMKYCPGHNIEKLVVTISQFLEVRGKDSRLAPASCVPLEQLVIQLKWCSRFCSRGVSRDPEEIDKAMEVIRNFPSDADIYIDDSEVKN
ncbi:hypothetical protein F5887DRAFT_985681 [Amanita rubescens]|nr:hypothetical protein F5887DRAFT_985681 [Amanita rubescens]